MPRTDLTLRLAAALAAVVWLVACSSSPPPVPPPPDDPLSEIPEGRVLTLHDPLAEEISRIDPTLDGWQTEALSDAAGARLEELGRLLVDPAGLDAAALEPLVAEGFTCSPLRPGSREAIYAQQGLEVVRGGPESGTLRGAAGLAEALTRLVEPYGRGAEIHSEMKIVQLTERDGERFETELLVHLWGQGPAGPVQQNATWAAAWIPGQVDARPLLAAIRLARYDENTAPARLFSDCTEAVIGHEAAYREQLLRGTDDWCARIDYAARMNQYAHNGLALGDVNGDGLDDVYILQSGGLPNRLFRQNADGTATDVSAEAGVDWLNESRAALFVDLDNDGDQDLLVSTMRGILVMRGDGAGRFAPAGSLPTTEGYSLAATDYDGDRLLDVYVCNYLQTSGGASLPSPYHDANNGTPNVLYRNLGGLRFEDVTERVGLDENNRRYSFAATWVDYDEDGDVDLYVANDFGRNNLYRNEDGRFRDVAGSAGVEDMAAGMGVSWADYDLDGDLDLYVSNMFSSAGRRVTYQRRFEPGGGPALRGAYQRHARGNSLFANRADGSFEDVTLTAEVFMGRWAWGAQFVDLNNDGLEDLYVPNGFFTNEDTGDL